MVIKNRTIVLLRHGQSEWNKLDLFTGWEDVGLSPEGLTEAIQAGHTLAKQNIFFDEVHCSMLKRAIKTAWVVLEELQIMATPIFYHWRLNERHYGALQGKNKAQTRAEFGEEQVKRWRRSYREDPPPLAQKSHPSELQLALGLNELPSGESLEKTIDRVIPYWNEVLLPKVSAGKTLLIAAHGNSLRALLKHLEKISEKDIINLEIPTGKPIMIRFDEKMNVLSRQYLS